MRASTRRYAMLRHIAVLLVALMTLLKSSNGVAVAGDPFTARSTGYDISYPQCGAPTPRGAFAVLGVNGGRPFSANRCLGGQYAAAPRVPAPALYLNTGYATAYQSFGTDLCGAAATSRPADEWQAYVIGCSEADYALAYADLQGAATASMWWLDVETANSWTGSTREHRTTLQGVVDRLARTGRPVGIYSTAAMWSVITGSPSWNPNGAVANWVPGARSAGTARSHCGSGFSGMPVWLVQYAGASADADHAC